MFRYALLLIFSSIIISQEVYEGYTIYTPGGMSNDNVTYLKDIAGSIVNSWAHNNGPASMPYLYPGNEPGFENIEDRYVGVLDLYNIVVISGFRRPHIQNQKSGY